MGENDIVLREKDIFFGESDIILRENDILLRENVILLRENDMEFELKSHLLGRMAEFVGFYELFLAGCFKIAGSLTVMRRRAVDY